MISLVQILVHVAKKVTMGQGNGVHANSFFTGRKIHIKHNNQSIRRKE
jgi:hypothetical protein